MLSAMYLASLQNMTKSTLLFLQIVCGCVIVAYFMIPSTMALLALHLVVAIPLWLSFYTLFTSLTL